MKILSSLIFGLFNFIPFVVLSQSFPVGHRTMNFTDPARNNRSVPSEVYYPGVTAGDNATAADGAFPVISFGHGFLMNYDSYLYLKDSLVPRGYIIVFTKTETGISPNHLEYGKDLAFLVVQMQTEGNSPSSPFYNHIDTTSAIMGHSMGGGASFLACENNPVPTVMVTFAAAETTPSAILAATEITIPALVFSADKDCVSPPAQNQLPMYDSLASDCKVFINIKGGGHCYFADYNFQCSLGEIGCQQNFTITREEQHKTTLDFLIPYLNYYLKKDDSSWVIFNDSLANSSRITYMKSCTTTGITNFPERKPFVVFPNPATGQVTIISDDRNEKINGIVIHSLTGMIVPGKYTLSAIGTDRELIDVSELQHGFYFLEVEGTHYKVTFKLVKN
ncbi:MAG: T9SS type A sorting domain-containing protein [Bacteroidetes bacterium]|nr:T9SS type A sorting domain-containing protein [Bacteroidota bacterium]